MTSEKVEMFYDWVLRKTREYKVALQSRGLEGRRIENRDAYLVVKDLYDTDKLRMFFLETGQKEQAKLDNFEGRVVAIIWENWPFEFDEESTFFLIGDNPRNENDFIRLSKYMSVKRLLADYTRMYFA
jgi:hypothetical protein